MCGRYTIIHSMDAVAERFGVRPFSLSQPRYNVAPGQAVPIIIQDRGDRQLLLARWGLVPFWAKDPDIGNKLINARVETLTEKPSFKYAFARRRCLIPADGFYEWQRGPSGNQPYYIRRKDGDLFAMAGLWETWESPDGSPLVSCAIITVPPNDIVKPIHDRMPALLLVADEDAWLQDVRGSRASPLKDSEPLERVLQLLRPYPDELMEAYPVSRYVNNPANDGPLCIVPAG